MWRVGGRDRRWRWWLLVGGLGEAVYLCCVMRCVSSASCVVDGQWCLSFIVSRLLSFVVLFCCCVVALVLRDLGVGLAVVFFVVYFSMPYLSPLSCAGCLLAPRLREQEKQRSNQREKSDEG